MTAEELFTKHYRGISNPYTPVIVEYGWIGPGLAYELARNTRGDVYGITVLAAQADGTTAERRDLRFAGSERDVWRKLGGRQVTPGPGHDDISML
jgi:hypothetical protein